MRERGICISDLVTSDAHEGLKSAHKAVYQGLLDAGKPKKLALTAPSRAPVSSAGVVQRPSTLRKTFAIAAPTNIPAGLKTKASSHPAHFAAASASRFCQ